MAAFANETILDSERYGSGDQCLIILGIFLRDSALKSNKIKTLLLHEQPALGGRGSWSPSDPVRGQRPPRPAVPPPGV